MQPPGLHLLTFALCCAKTHTASAWWNCFQQVAPLQPPLPTSIDDEETDDEGEQQGEQDEADEDDVDAEEDEEADAGQPAADNEAAEDQVNYKVW